MIVRGWKFLLQIAALLVAVVAPASTIAQSGPAFTLTTSVAFPSTAAGATSTPQTLVLTTTRAVTISSITTLTTNGVHEFSVGTVAGCSTGTVNASGTVCAIPITFAPTYTGVRTNSVNITDSTGQVFSIGIAGYATGPQTILTPTGIGTVAGSGSFGYAGDAGVATSAKLQYPTGITTDSANNLYIADVGTSNIRVVYQGGAALACVIEIEEPTLFGLATGSTSCSGATSSPVAGYMYTLAGDRGSSTHLKGSDNGVLATATTTTTSTLNAPAGVAVDKEGNVIVSDYNTYIIRVIYVGGSSMACLIQVENPTLFGLSSTATSCTGATSSPVPGFIYTIAGQAAVPGSSGDGGKATAATMAVLYAPAVSKDGDIFIADDSTVSTRSSRLRVLYNGGAAAASLIVAANPGTVPVVGNIYKLLGGSVSSSGEGVASSAASMIYCKGVAVDSDGDLVFTDYNIASLVSTLPLTGKVRVIYNGGATMAALIRLENPSITPVIGNVYSIAGAGSGAAGSASGNSALAYNASFIQPYGVALDPAGDIFVADYADHTVRKISAADGFIYPMAGTSGASGSTYGNALTTGRFYNPYGLALASNSTLNVSDYGIDWVRDVNLTTSTYAFPTAISKGNTGTPTYFYFTNQGTSASTITSITVSTNFAILPIDTTASLYQKDCSSLVTLNAGDTCAIAVALQPTVGGNISGTLTVSDNTNGVAGTKHTVTLTGLAGLQTQVTLTSSANPTFAGDTVTYTAVASVVPGQDTTGVAALAGTIAFLDGTTTIAGSPVTIDANGNATITEGPLTGGSHTIKATFTPTSSLLTTYSTSSTTLSQSSPAIATNTTLTSSKLSADINSNVTLTATVAVSTSQTLPAGAPTLTGSVTFTDTTKGTVIASGIAINASGIASTQTNSLVAGTHTITAAFTPTSIYYATSTATISQVIVPPSWSVTPNIAGVAVAAGKSTNVAFVVASAGGLSDTVSASCSGLAQGLSCSFAPASGVTFTGSDDSKTITLTINSVNLTASRASSNRGLFLASLLGVFSLSLLFRSRKLPRLLALLLTATALASMSGCSGKATQSQLNTSSFNVVFTGSTTSVTIPVSVSVTSQSW